MAKIKKEKTIGRTIAMFLLGAAVSAGAVWLMGTFMSYVVARSWAYILTFAISSTAIGRVISIAAKKSILKRVAKKAETPEQQEKMEQNYRKLLSKGRYNKILKSTDIPSLTLSEFNSITELYQNDEAPVVQTQEKNIGRSGR